MARKPKKQSRNHQGRREKPKEERFMPGDLDANCTGERSKEI
jgi:hypothetical protein